MNQGHCFFLTKIQATLYYTCTCRYMSLTYDSAQLTGARVSLGIQDRLMNLSRSANTDDVTLLNTGPTGEG